MNQVSLSSNQGIWVVGTKFGAYYAHALQGRGLRALIGKEGIQGRQLAKKLNYDYFSDIESALADNRPTCAIVAVRSSIVGGDGDQIVRRLLQEGILVLQELPMHPQDMVQSLHIARENNTRFQITPVYDHTPSVRCFLHAAQKLSDQSGIRSVEMRVSIQTLTCALLVLAEIIGSPSLAITTTPMAGFAKILISGSWQGTAVDIVLFNRFDAASPDDNAQPLMQIILISDEGELMLHSPYGQVIWESRFQQSQSIIKEQNIGQKDFLFYSSPLKGVPIQDHLFQDINSAIRSTVAQFITSHQANNAQLQRQLTVLQLWQIIGTQVGQPQQQNLPPPKAIGNTAWGLLRESLNNGYYYPSRKYR